MSDLDIPMPDMPKSWVLAPSTTAYAHDIPISVGTKPMGNFNIPLPLGASMVRVTWDGETWLAIKRRIGDTDTTIHTIPAGVGTRSVVLDVPSRVVGETLRFGVPFPPQSDVDNARASVLLIHTPPAT